MSTKLPLPLDPKRPRLDVIVLVLDMASNASMHTLTANLELLDTDFFFGRAALCVVNGKSAPPSILVFTNMNPFHSLRQPGPCLRLGSCAKCGEQPQPSNIRRWRRDGWWMLSHNTTSFLGDSGQPQKNRNTAVMGFRKHRCRIAGMIRQIRLTVTT